MWGLCDQRTSSGAPCATSVSSTVLMRPSWVPVVSLPSENVPAPPSPNCTLDVSSSSPVRQKCSTSRARSSTGFPRSSTTEGTPARARYRAQNNPAGPMPTMTGRRADCRVTAGKRYSARSTARTCPFARLSARGSSSTAACTVQTRWI